MEKLKQKCVCASSIAPLFSVSASDHIMDCVVCNMQYVICNMQFIGRKTWVALYEKWQVNDYEYDNDNDNDIDNDNDKLYRVMSCSLESSPV